MKQPRPRYSVVLAPDEPPLRLCTRDFQAAQQWCNEMADIVGAAVELLIYSQAQVGRVRCEPIDAMLQLPEVDRQLDEQLRAVDAMIENWPKLE